MLEQTGPTLDKAASRAKTGTLESKNDGDDPRAEPLCVFIRKERVGLKNTNGKVKGRRNEVKAKGGLRHRDKRSRAVIGGANLSS